MTKPFSHPLKTILPMVFFSFCLSASAQWSHAPGPDGGYGLSVLATPEYVLVGLEDGGVYRSTDSGASWRDAFYGMTAEGSDANCFLTLGPFVYVATARGVDRSTDQGLTWSPLDIGFPLYGISVSSLAINGSTLFLGSPWYGVYASPDSGTTWVRKSTGLTDTTIMALIADSGYLLAGSDGDGVFVSSDNGEHWQPSSSGIGVGNAQRVYGFASVPGVIVAGTRAGAYRSTDHGATWTVAASGLTSMDVASLGVVGNDLLAGTYGSGVYRSTNGGIDWEPSSSGWPFGNVRGFSAAAGTLFGCNYGKPVVFRSTNGGLDWFPSGTGIRSAPIRSLTAVGKTILVGTNEGLEVSSDSGRTWTEIAQFTNRTIYNFGVFGSRVYACTGGDGVFASTDQGSTWFDANGNLPSGGWRPVYSIAVDSSFIYIGTGMGIFRSSDQGTTWGPAMNGMSDSVAFAICSAGGTLFAGTSTLMFVSTNHGTAWTPSTSGLPVYTITSIVSLDNAVLAAYALGGNPTVYKTTDNGQSWSPVSQGLATYSTTIQTLCVNGHDVFGGTNANGVWRSTDKGDTWSDISDGLSGPGLNIDAFTVANGYLFAGAERGGLWYRSLSEVVVSTDAKGKNPLAVDFLLDQNYPNPFNPTTGIRVQLSGDREMRLVVYDLLGREVAVLANGRYLAGEHTFTFDGGNLSSGVYFYRLTAGGYTAVRKMILSK